MKSKITATKRPFKYLSYSEKTGSFLVLAFLLAHILLLALTESWSSLVIAVATVAAAVAVETLELAFKRSKPAVYGFLSSVIQGILVALFLPSSFPFYAAFLSTFLVFFCCRFFIGTFADNWINLPALTVCFCWILGGSVFPPYQITHEILLARNPSLALIQNGAFPLASFDTKITAFLNKTVFSLFGVSIPDGYVSLFWDTHSLIPAFRFNLVTLVSSIFLISMDVVRALIPSLFLLVYAALVYFVAPFFYSSFPGHGDLVLALCTSGMLPCALFMLQLAGTYPVTLCGKICYGVFGGVIAFLIAGAGTSPCGAMFTVLAMNVFSPLVCHAEHILEMRKVTSTLLPRTMELEEGVNA